MNVLTVFFLQAPAAGPAGGGSMMWIMLIAKLIHPTVYQSSHTSKICLLKSYLFYDLMICNLHFDSL